MDGKNSPWQPKDKRRKKKSLLLPLQSCRQRVKQPTLFNRGRCFEKTQSPPSFQVPRDTSSLSRPSSAESRPTILFFSGGSESEYKAVGLWRSATTKKREIKSKSLNSGNRIRPPIPNGRPKEERSRAVLTLPHPLLPLAKQRPPKQKIKVGLFKKFTDPPPIPLTKKKPKKW
ncbi:hypothetical protein ACFX13_046004 [Malus domestica]